MRTRAPMMNEPAYDPNRLLDEILLKLSLKNDAALSRSLGVGPSVLSKVRHGRTPVPALLIIQIHEATALSIDDIHFLMGVPSFRQQRHAAREHRAENHN